MSVEAILAQSRQREVSMARQISMYLTKKHTKLTLADIGRRHGNRTHATVAHAIDVLNVQQKADISLGQRIRRIERQIVD